MTAVIEWAPSKWTFLKCFLNDTSLILTELYEDLDYARVMSLRRLWTHKHAGLFHNPLLLFYTDKQDNK